MAWIQKNDAKNVRKNVNEMGYKRSNNEILTCNYRVIQNLHPLLGEGPG